MFDLVVSSKLFLQLELFLILEHYSITQELELFLMIALHHYTTRAKLAAPSSTHWRGLLLYSDENIKNSSPCLGSSAVPGSSSGVEVGSDSFEDSFVLCCRVMAGVRFVLSRIVSN